MAARFRVFEPKPALRLTLHERTTPPPPPHRTHHYTTHTHRPPSSFHTACLKSSLNGSVSGFDPNLLPASRFPKPPLSPRVCEHNAPSPPPPHPHHPITFSHRSPSQFPTAHPKSSPSGSTLNFWPSGPSPASRLQTQCPAITTTSLALLHHLPPPLSTPISDGAREIKPQWLGFGFGFLPLIN
ncbi:hypothetical protein PILCRDRAFT_16049 [Piloderma croceum F 1598]|uniref:Uncharacterized protein n=1 Tax=Piloderma croceum (strain F 1598) TaxID=765440 RepID=A0A0C3EXP9_PILCF|nr:hypothetical protein PILCRDRAFT_16049 [Piloderma croceum F 1598]